MICRTVAMRMEGYQAEIPIQRQRPFFEIYQLTNFNLLTRELTTFVQMLRLWRLKAVRILRSRQSFASTTATSFFTTG